MDSSKINDRITDGDHQISMPAIDFNTDPDLGQNHTEEIDAKNEISRKIISIRDADVIDDVVGRVDRSICQLCRRLRGKIDIDSPKEVEIPRFETYEEKRNHARIHFNEIKCTILFRGDEKAMLRFEFLRCFPDSIKFWADHMEINDSKGQSIIDNLENQLKIANGKNQMEIDDQKKNPGEMANPIEIDDPKNQESIANDHRTDGDVSNQATSPDRGDQNGGDQFLSGHPSDPVHFCIDNSETGKIDSNDRGSKIDRYGDDLEANNGSDGLQIDDSTLIGKNADRSQESDSTIDEKRRLRKRNRKSIGGGKIDHVTKARKICADGSFKSVIGRQFTTDTEESANRSIDQLSTGVQKPIIDHEIDVESPRIEFAIINPRSSWRGRNRLPRCDRSTWQSHDRSVSGDGSTEITLDRSTSNQAYDQIIDRQFSSCSTADQPSVQSIIPLRAPDQSIIQSRSPDQSVTQARSPDQSITQSRSPDQSITPSRSPDQSITQARSPDQSKPQGRFRGTFQSKIYTELLKYGIDVEKFRQMDYLTCAFCSKQVKIKNGQNFLLPNAFTHVLRHMGLVNGGNAKYERGHSRQIMEDNHQEVASNFAKFFGHQ